MTTQPHQTVSLNLGTVELSEADGAYVVGAYLERRAAKEARAGREAAETYHLSDFVREALIAAADQGA